MTEGSIRVENPPGQRVFTFHAVFGKSCLMVPRISSLLTRAVALPNALGTVPASASAPRPPESVLLSLFLETHS